MPENNAKPGYYPDPAGDNTKLRYWNGSAWEDKYCDIPPQADSVSQNPQAASTDSSTSASVDAATDTANAAGFTTNAESQTISVVDQGNQGNQESQGAPTLYFVSETDKNLRLAAFVLSVIACVGIGWLIVPLAWTIPMTVHTYKIYKGQKPNTVAFGVCELLFVGLIAGVLLLCTHKDQ